MNRPATRCRPNSNKPRCGCSKTLYTCLRRPRRRQANCFGKDTTQAPSQQPCVLRICEAIGFEYSPTGPICKADYRSLRWLIAGRNRTISVRTPPAGGPCRSPQCGILFSHHCWLSAHPSLLLSGCDYSKQENPLEMYDRLAEFSTVGR